MRTTATLPRSTPVAGLTGELSRVSAFLRRDLLTAWSYRAAFFSDAFGLVAQALLFFYLSRLVDPATMPAYGGRQVAYISFVVVGIALAAFVQVGLGRMVSAIRREQMQGTLESLLVTPTRPATILLGSVVYDLVYVPVRTAVFFAIAAVAFGVHFDPSGFGPAAAVLLLFIPFVWGLGLGSAAGVIAFRRSSGPFGLLGYGLMFASGAYFPLHLFPGWLEAAAAANPVAVALSAIRGALLGGAGWADTAPALGVLAAAAVVTLGAGTAALRVALRRERRRGTVGLY